MPISAGAGDDSSYSQVSLSDAQSNIHENSLSEVNEELELFSEDCDRNKGVNANNL